MLTQLKFNLVTALIITSRSFLNTTDCSGNSRGMPPFAYIEILRARCRQHILFWIRKNCCVSSRIQNRDMGVSEKREKERKGHVTCSSSANSTCKLHDRSHCTTACKQLAPLRAVRACSSPKQTMQRVEAQIKEKQKSSPLPPSLPACLLTVAKILKKCLN